MWFVFPHNAFNRVEKPHSVCSFELFLKSAVLEIMLTKATNL